MIFVLYLSQAASDECGSSDFTAVHILGIEGENAT